MSRSQIPPAAADAASAPRPALLRACGRSIELPHERPLLMGIVNVGEDSVADELRLATLPQQLAHARRLISDGAEIIDVGVQSGRTDTAEISEAQEIERMLPLVRALAAEGATVSIDTYRANVAAAAIEAGAAIVNDVSGLHDREMAAVAARTGAALVLTDTRAAPKRVSFPGYERPLTEVRAMLEALTARATAAGIAQEQLILDPGLDFAKTPAESIEVLRGLAGLHELGRPLLLAVSRKYFVGMITGRAPTERLAGTLAAVGFGVQQAAAQIVRVHDVRETADFLAVQRALHTDGPAQLRGDAEDESLKWIAPKAPLPDG